MPAKITIPNGTTLPRRCIITGAESATLEPVSWSYGKAGQRPTHSFSFFISPEGISAKKRAYKKWKLAVYFSPLVCIALVVIGETLPGLPDVFTVGFLGFVVSIGFVLYTALFGKLNYIRARPALSSDGIVVVGVLESFAGVTAATLK